MQLSDYNVSCCQIWIYLSLMPLLLLVTLWVFALFQSGLPCLWRRHAMWGRSSCPIVARSWLGFCCVWGNRQMEAAFGQAMSLTCILRQKQTQIQIMIKVTFYLHWDNKYYPTEEDIGWWTYHHVVHWGRMIADNFPPPTFQQIISRYLHVCQISRSAQDHVPGVTWPWGMATCDGEQTPPPFSAPPSPLLAPQTVPFLPLTHGLICFVRGG